MNRFLPVALAAVGLLAAAQPSVASPDGDDAASVSVRYGDLDLNREVGARVMLIRLTAAARTLCGPAPSIRDLERFDLYESCVNDAVGRGVRSLDMPMVSALWDGRSVTEDMASAAGAH